MSTSVIEQTSGRPQVQCDPAHRVTRSLLGYGLLAGVFYLGVSLVEASLRDGFQLDRHALSLLSNGPWRWVHVANLALTGAMVLAAAVGLARAMPSGIGRSWVPRLVAGYGLGLVAAAVFPADPMQGFLGTPDGPPVDPSLAGTLHFVAGGLGMACLTVAALIVARRLSAEGRRGAAWASGLAAVVALGGMMTGTIVGIWIGVVAAWLWLAAISVNQYRGLGRQVSASAA